MKTSCVEIVRTDGERHPAVHLNAQNESIEQLTSTRVRLLANGQGGGQHRSRGVGDGGSVMALDVQRIAEIPVH
ncbi:MAG: hypothetical protein WBW04_06845 [Nitrolancea sp.]